MTALVKFFWPGFRLMILPFVWLSWFPAVAIMLAGIGLILRAFMDSNGWIIKVVCAFAACSVAAVIFKVRRQIIERK